MNNKIIVLFLLLLLPLTIFATDSEKVDDAVVEELLQAEKVSVVVVLDEDAELSVESREVVITDNAWHTSDDEISRNDIKVTHEYSATINGFAAEVTEDGLDQLQESDNVERVYYDSVYSLSLEDSVPQVNATDVHSIYLNSVGLDGQGQTVCVIDTGINYNHADLGGCFGNNNVSSDCKVIGGEDIYNGDMDPIDDHGHGTHVAGIVAADGTIIGVAPGANLIAMKVFGSDQSTTASKILAGIDWCVSNSSEFNISVITMSLSLTNGLGSEIVFSSESECDSYASDGGVVAAANDAAAQGILVTVAAGNDGSTDGISLPACGSNITSVGAVNDSNTIFFNRMNLLDLLAPGININSADEVDSNYVEMSGTSMATPHVAGAGAILQQYAQDFEARTLTPAQIEQTLVDYGTLINDTSETQLNFPLLNIYSSLLSLDTVGPEISITVPNGSVMSIGDSITVSVSDLHGVSAVWYEKDTVTFEPYSNGTDWFIDANWSTGEQQLILYANDTLSYVTHTPLTITLSSAPTIDDWLWTDSTGTFDSSNITINENDTLSMLVNVSDADADTLTFSWVLADVEINDTEDMSYSIGLNESKNTTLVLTVSDGVTDVMNNWSVQIADPFAPEFSTISSQTANEGAWSLSVSGYVTNLDEDDLIYSVSSGFSVSELGVISRGFGCDGSGIYTVEVTVSDGYSSSLASFNLEIEDTDECDNDDDDDDDDDGGDGDGGGAGTGGGAGDGPELTPAVLETKTETKTTSNVVKNTPKEVPKPTVESNNSDSETFATNEGKPFSLDILGKFIDDFDYNNIDMKYKQIVAVVVCGSLIGAYLYPNYRKRKGKTLHVRVSHGYEKGWRK
jgi:subtilisin family serine protease